MLMTSLRIARRRGAVGAETTHIASSPKEPLGLYFGVDRRDARRSAKWRRERFERTGEGGGFKSNVSEQMDAISERESSKRQFIDPIATIISPSDNEFADVEYLMAGAKVVLATLAGTVGPYLRADGTIFHRLRRAQQ